MSVGTFDMSSPAQGFVGFADSFEPGTLLRFNGSEGCFTGRVVRHHDGTLYILPVKRPSKGYRRHVRRMKARKAKSCCF